MGSNLSKGPASILPPDERHSGDNSEQVDSPDKVGASIRKVRVELARLRHRRPFGLVSDIDGTLSPLAPTPGEARIDARSLEALRVLRVRLDVVAIVSGRPAAEARRMVGLDGVHYFGNHGLERWVDGCILPSEAAAPYISTLKKALGDLRTQLDIPGLVFEDKGLTAAVHYRLANNPRAARAAVYAAARAIAARTGLVVTEGNHVVELRPPVPVDKGTAVQILVSSHHLRSVVYIGDDNTDIAAFREVRTLRSKGACDGIAIAVEGRETPGSVLGMADCGVAGTEAVARLLTWMAREVD